VDLPPSVAVIIPALDEEDAVGRVLADIPPPYRDRILVVDNGSRDKTAERADAGGARVLREPERGYGAACLRGLAALAEAPPHIVVFLDADYSDDPAEMPALVMPLLRGDADLTIGSRVLGKRERGALPPHARFGNTLATCLIRWLYGARYTDLGPFRAATWEALTRLDMKDRDFGWTVEMQVKAARAGLRVLEVPVSYRRRVGRSKISGTVRGTVHAGKKILWVVFREAMRSRPLPPDS
jgi:glycosyltransferase involved in cell wall biosynthesis